MSECDVAVIGGGAAGLSAALVLARARRTVAVIDAGEPRNAPAAQMHGFLSRDGLAPAELLDIGRSEVKGYGARIIEGRVVEIKPATPAGPGRAGPRLTVLLGDGQALVARRVVVATGLRDELPDIAGVGERWGRDLLHCPYCHGYEVRDQPVAVLGGTPGSAQHAQLVRQWSDDVVFFPHTGTVSDEEREQLTARAIGVVDGVVSRLVVTDDRLSGIELADGRVVRRSAAFVRPTLVPNDDLLRGLGCTVDDAGWVVTDRSGRTSVAGVWAAGNAADPSAQVITAAGEGSATAIALNADLIADDIADALVSYRSGS